MGGRVGRRNSWPIVDSGKMLAQEQNEGTIKRKEAQFAQKKGSHAQNPRSRRMSTPLAGEKPTQFDVYGVTSAPLAGEKSRGEVYRGPSRGGPGSSQDTFPPAKQMYTVVDASGKQMYQHDTVDAGGKHLYQLRNNPHANTQHSMGMRSNRQIACERKTGTSYPVNSFARHLKGAQESNSYQPKINFSLQRVEDAQQKFYLELSGSQKCGIKNARMVCHTLDAQEMGCENGSLIKSADTPAVMGRHCEEREQYEWGMAQQEMLFERKMQAMQEMMKQKLIHQQKVIEEQAVTLKKQQMLLEQQPRLDPSELDTHIELHLHLNLSEIVNRRSAFPGQPVKVFVKIHPTQGDDIDPLHTHSKESFKTPDNVTRKKKKMRNMDSVHGDEHLPFQDDLNDFQPVKLGNQKNEPKKKDAIPLWPALILTSNEDSGPHAAHPDDADESDTDTTLSSGFDSSSNR